MKDQNKGNIKSTKKIKKLKITKSEIHKSEIEIEFHLGKYLCISRWVNLKVKDRNFEF